MVSVVMRTLCSMNSFQVYRKSMMTAEAIAGLASGMMMLQYRRKFVQPSMRAASSSSFGMLRKKPRNTSVASGIPKPRYVRIRQ